MYSTRPNRAQAAAAKGHGQKHGIWDYFIQVVPAQKGIKQHPDVQCRYCKRMIYNAQRKKNLAPHFAGTSKAPKCENIPPDVARRHGRITPVRNSSARRALFGNDGHPIPRSSVCRATQEELELSFAEMCYATGASFCMVEDPAVKTFFAQACPGFRLPSRKRIAGPLLDQVYLARKAAVIDSLKEQPYMALSTDGWSNTNNQSIINFMLASPDMKPVFWKSIATGEEEHSGVYIAGCINDVINEVEAAIGAPGTFCSVVTDNAKNMLTAWTELKKTRPYIICTGCGAHSFNLVMKNVLKINRIAAVQDDAKHVAKFIRVRHGLLDRFRTKQRGMTTTGEKQLALSVPIPTRWYTVEKCVRSVFRNQYTIRSMFDDSTLLKRYNTKETRFKLERAQSIVADQNKWNECKRVVDILSPINESLALSEKDKTYISSIYSEFVKLKDLNVYHSPIADATADDRIKYGEIQSEVLQLIEGRRNFLVTAPVRAAYLLDQTTDISKFAAGTAQVKGDLDLAMSDIVTMAKAITKDPKILKKYEGEVEEWSRLRHYWQRTNTAPKHFPCSPSSYWMMHGNKRFPLLSGIAEKFFTIPSSSASSERSWSIHDFIHTKRRNRLHASRVEKLVFVYSNIVATTSEPVRDNVADDMYPDAHDGDLDTSDDEDDVNGVEAFDDDDDEVMDTAEDGPANEEMQEMADIV